MKNLTLRNITRACSGTWHGKSEYLDREIQSITTDSREAKEGCLFVPIVGERVDAHRFIPQVISAGALAVLSEKELPQADFPWIRVESSLQAVKDIAAFYLEQLGIPVVGITGSVGKTSTKEAIAAVLSQKYRTLKTQGNFNNELGVPLTVFRLREEDEIAVLEMGINHFGEMTRLARIARPDTAVITNIGTAHLEYLQDRDGVLRAKTEMLDFLRDHGHIVLNGDDDKLATIHEVKGIRPVFYGLEDNGRNTVRADVLESLGLMGTRCRLHLPETLEVVVPLPGIHMVYNALAAAAVGRIYGLDNDQIKAGIEAMETIGGRMNRIRTEKYLIVDDCYNANPVSMKASIDVMKNASGRRVLILGDMGELGEDAPAMHEEVGAYAADSGAEVLLFAGELAEHMVTGARRRAVPGQVTAHFGTVPELLAGLGQYIREGDTILVKASRFMKLEGVVEELKGKL